jgi:hypothetical protein
MVTTGRRIICKNAVRSGGLPKEDCSGLIAPSWVVSPLQLRPAYIGDSQKAYKCRITGLKDKYEEASDISYFADEFWRHLEATGMDTIAYLMDPETSDVVSVVLKHIRFTVASATALARAQAKKYDDNDRGNDTAATECLLDSVSPDLKKRIRNRIEDTDTFPKVWIEFITFVLSPLTATRSSRSEFRAGNRRNMQARIWASWWKTLAPTQRR